MRPALAASVQALIHVSLVILEVLSIDFWCCSGYYYCINCNVLYGWETPTAVCICQERYLLFRGIFALSCQQSCKAHKYWRFAVPCAVAVRSCVRGTAIILLLSCPVLF